MCDDNKKQLNYQIFAVEKKPSCWSSHLSGVFYSTQLVQALPPRLGLRAWRSLTALVLSSGLRNKIYSPPRWIVVAIQALYNCSSRDTLAQNGESNYGQGNLKLITRLKDLFKTGVLVS